MSLGARGGAKGAKGGSGKDRHAQDKKDKPQPKEKVKPQATTEQIRLANMIDRKTSDDGADVRKMVQDLMEMTCRTEEEVCSALHDSDNDVVAACNILLEAEKTGEWQTSEKKKKKPPQPVNNGEVVPPRERDRAGGNPRPRRGEGERGERGGRGAGRGGRGGGRGGRGGARGRPLPRPRTGPAHDWQHSQYNDTNQMGDAFPATEDWDNEEWSGSLSDTKVFTPSAAALPPSEPEGAVLPPTEDWESTAVPAAGSATAGAGSDPHNIPTYTYHNAAQHHVNIEQLNSASLAPPAAPPADQLPSDHYLHQQHQIQHPPVQPMGMSGSLSAAQSQYLSQLTQQSQRHDAGVYSSNYGVYGSADITSQRKPQRARVPPPSKIPSMAVEMPGGELAGGMFLDVQFGALEPDALRDPPPPHKHAQTPSHVPNHVPHATPPPAPAPAPASPAAEPAPVPAPPAPAPAPQPAPQPVYSQHQPLQLNESLSSVESTSTTQAPLAPEPAITTNAASSLEKQLSASMKQLSASDSSVPHAPYAHRSKTGASAQNVYAHPGTAHPPPAPYPPNVYATQVNSSSAPLSAAGGLGAGYPSSVTLTQYQPILNSYQQTSAPGAAYSSSALYTPAAPYAYQQPHHKHKDPHQYESSSTGTSSSLANTSTTQTSSAKVATSSAPAPAPAPAPAAAYAQGALYGSQGYAYDDQLMRSTMPHHMGGYYEVGYGVGGAREASFGLGAGERFGRTDAASPQQVPAGALPPGYAYFYQPPPPTTYQYGVYPTYGGASSVGGVGGVAAQGKGPYAQQQYDAQDSYKPGGPYAGSGSKAGGAASTDLTNAMYAKTHVALNKVNSYEKATFHSGTPPPFGAASHLYIPAPPHHHHVPQPHQMDVRMNSNISRQEAGSTGGRTSNSKTAHSKPTYSHSYWPPN